MDPSTIEIRKYKVPNSHNLLKSPNIQKSLPHIHITFNFNDLYITMLSLMFSNENNLFMTAQQKLALVYKIIVFFLD